MSPAHRVPHSTANGAFAIALSLSLTSLSQAGSGTASIEFTNVDEATKGYLVVDDHPALQPQQFTLETWMTPMGPGFGNTTIDAYGAVVVAKIQEGIAGNYLPYQLNWSPLTEGVVAVVGHNLAEGVYVFSSKSVPLGCRTHVAFTFDGSVVRLYLNGEFDNQVDFPFDGIVYGGNPRLGPENVVIGAGNAGAGYLRRYQGRVDDVRLWDYARSGEDIDAHRDCPLDGDEPGLIAHWAFDGDSLADQTVHGHDGVLVGTASFAADLLPCVIPIGDLNASTAVDGADLGALLAFWGTDDSGADLNCDGTVDGADLGILLGNWTK